MRTLIPTDSIFSGRPVTIRERVGPCVFTAVGAAMTVVAMLREYPYHVAKDSTYPLRAARALLSGRSPNHVR